MPESTYQRLTRPSSGFAVAVFTRSSLWLGKDHLLCLDAASYSETYKRFFFRDIQSISIQMTMRRVYWNWFLGIPTAVFLLAGVPYFAFGTRKSTGELIAVSIITAAFLIPLVVNNLLGPTCSCRIKTAVQSEELRSLRRLRKTEKVIGRLRPLIAASQGTLAPEEVAARLRAAGVSEEPPPAEPAPPGPGDLDVPPVIAQ